MSVKSEIERLETAKADIASAITEKGVTVPDGATLSDMADLIKGIETVSYTLSISGSKITLNGSDGTSSSVTLPYAKIPWDTWDGFGSANTLTMPSAGWYVLQRVPGSGVLVKCESNWDDSSERTLWYTNEAGEQIYVWFGKSNALKSAKYSNGTWTDVNTYVYYSKLS